MCNQHSVSCYKSTQTKVYNVLEKKANRFSQTQIYTTLNSIIPSWGWYAAIPQILKSPPSLPITESSKFSETHFSIKSKHSYNHIENEKHAINTNEILLTYQKKKTNEPTKNKTRRPKQKLTLFSDNPSWIIPFGLSNLLYGSSVTLSKPI
jgi:hypothetical protein